MTVTMEPIFPISALQKKQGEIKKAAQSNIVRITENGVGAYVFCTEDMFQEKLKEAAESAVYEACMASAIERGRADIAAGRYVKGIEAAYEEVKRRTDA
ncbi:hypothetical protein [Adlercreutzia sp. ZJ154]|uniref:hypothetical protein n=1 Tax=Adlercreutzia sp. ZJ154 TaxID=2709790 RepID=UPI0013ED4965|nr:hypothetical protein [Adlercreutzia sp. ZJ154]